MQPQRRRHGLPLAIAVMLFNTVAPAWTAEQGYQGELDPFPFTPATRANVEGSGSISATLDGKTLRVTGTFTNLAAPATAAQLRMGLAMGVPGPVIAELTVPHAVTGAISGQVTLNDAQLAGLRGKAIYVQIDSVKAPEGNLWGWLEAR
jgi:hypothetical protein